MQLSKCLSNISVISGLLTALAQGEVSQKQDFPCGQIVTAASTWCPGRLCLAWHRRHEGTLELSCLLCFGVVEFKDHCPMGSRTGSRHPEELLAKWVACPVMPFEKMGPLRGVQVYLRPAVTVTM